MMYLRLLGLIASGVVRSTLTPKISSRKSASGKKRADRLFKLHNDIEVAFLILLTPCIRAENSDFFNLVFFF